MMNNSIDGSPATGLEGTTLVKKTMVGAAWLLIWKLVARSLGLMSTLVLARVLLPSDFGILAMAGTLAAVIEALSQLGLQDALVRHVGDDRRLFDTAFTLQIGRALVISATIIVLAPVAVWWFDEPRLSPILFVLAGSSLIGGAENVGLAAFRRAMRFDIQFKLLLVARLTQLFVTLPMALLLHSYWALICGILASQIARIMTGYIVHPYRPRIRLEGWRELAGFSFWIWAAAAASVVWDRVDPFIVGPMIGTAQLGLYLISVDLASLPVTEIVSPIADVLFASFAVAQKNGRSSVHHAPLVAATLIMCLVPIVVTISCGAGYVVAALLGPKWVAAKTLVAILAWLCVFSPISYVCNMVLVANGFVRRNFIGKVLASTIKLAVLLSTVALTGDLTMIAVAITICVAAESCSFRLLLSGLGDVRPAPTFGAITRALLSGAFIVALLYKMGMAWEDVTMPSLQAFLHGIKLGLFVTVLYVPSVIGLWFIAGRPTGPETQMLNLALVYLQPLLARFRRA